MNLRSQEKPRALGIIPARGGSKRLPRKNVRLVGDKPLIAHTIVAAQKASALTDYIVSSEDEEILTVARQFGAQVPFIRPQELATDEVRNIDVMLHAVHFMERQIDAAYDIIVLLQPTVPVRDPEHINQAVNLLWSSDASTLASVKGPFKKRDPNLKRLADDGKLVPYCDRAAGEEWDPFYIYNASIYAMRRDYLIAEQKMVSSEQVALVMDEAHSIDIDTEMDAIVADAVLRHRAGEMSKGENL